MKINITLRNCYGINYLEKSIGLEKNLSCNGVNSLYAPNGTLKTSLAKVFRDVEKNNESKDLIFPERASSRSITVDEVNIESNQVMVIDSYNESYSSQQISSLLVDEELKQQYELALKEVDSKRLELIKLLSKLSGKQAKSIPEIVCESFNRSQKDFLSLLTELSHEDHADYRQFSEFKYSDLFNNKIIELISTGTLNHDLAEYIDTYEKLISESTVLSKTFNHQRAGDVSKNLGGSGFFTASHSVNLNIDGEKQEVNSNSKLNELLQTEQEKVLQNPELRQKFEKVDGKLKTKDTQNFRDFITEHQYLLQEYKDIKLFKKKVIIAYLQSVQMLWDELIDIYNKNKTIVENITTQACEQKTTWEAVVNTFNKRFSVPFKLSIENQEEVILNSAAPTIKFDFDDGRGDPQSVEKSSLIESLSQGEKRALYILNVLFEVEVRKRESYPILIIVDDIADSFDYKNKYAIIEYLRDISKVGNFHLLLLTHNFDFHRIISSRLMIKRENRLMAIRSTDKIEIVQEKYQSDVFSTWKRNLHKNESYMIASIPFARNIAEYCGYAEHFNTITSLLHLKENTKSITLQNIQEIYREIFKDLPGLAIPNGDAKVLDKIIEHSNQLIDSRNDTPELEFKVIIAMGIRIKTEEFMIREIDDSEFVNSITLNQTRCLFEKYVERYPEAEKTISLLDQVNLMTPENIHLNSFMYEPILDMSAHRLYELYEEISKLTE